MIPSKRRQDAKSIITRWLQAATRMLSLRQRRRVALAELPVVAVCSAEGSGPVTDRHERPPVDAREHLGELCCYLPEVRTDDAEEVHAYQRHL